ncbi:hypothetical protein BDV09DRAFT_91064 [Aspergillus tetrazonus]
MLLLSCRYSSPCTSTSCWLEEAKTCLRLCWLFGHAHRILTLYGHICIVLSRCSTRLCPRFCILVIGWLVLLLAICIP